MVLNLDNLTVSVDIDVDGLSQLDRLATKLEKVAVAQSMVDEDMTIDVDANTDVRGLSAISDRLGIGPQGDSERLDRFDDLREALGKDNIRVDVDVSGLYYLDRLSTKLGKVATAQQLVDEDMTIDVGSRTSLTGFSFLGQTDEVFEERLERFSDLKESLGDHDLDIGVDVDGMGQLDRLARKLEKVIALKHAAGDEIDFSVDGDSSGMGGAMATAGGRNLDRGMGGSDDEGTDWLDAFNLNMSEFHNLVAKLLPLLLTIVGSLPAVITAMATLAGAAIAAAGALTAIGGLAFMGLASQRGDGNLQQGFQSIIEDLRESFLDTFLPVAERFDDLALDALEGITRLFDDIAAQSGVLIALKDEARAFGGFILDTLPQLLAKLGRVAESFSGIFAMAGEWLKTTDIIGGFVEATRIALPPFMALVDAFINILPVIVEISTGFLYVTSAIFGFIDVVFSIVNALGPLGIGLGIVLGALLTLTTVVAVSAKVWGIWTGTVGSAVINAAFGAANAIRGLTLAQIKATIATLSFARAIRILLAATGIGLLITGVGFLAQKFMGLNKNIREATNSLKNFDSAASGVGGNVGVGVGTSGVNAGISPSARSRSESAVQVNIYGDASTEDVERGVSKAMWRDSTVTGTGTPR